VNLERFLERQIAIILSEQVEDGVEQTAGRATGRSKKAVEQTKNAAVNEPAKLMKRLQIGGVTGKNNIEKMFNLLKQAQSGADPMQEAYGSPSAHKHQLSGREGVRVPFSVIPVKEARRYLEYTILGAVKSGVAKFDDASAPAESLKGIQVEALGGDILIYFSPKRNTWHEAPKKAKAKKDETE
jgi:hypothetical protein